MTPGRPITTETLLPSNELYRTSGYQMEVFRHALTWFYFQSAACLASSHADSCNDSIWQISPVHFQGFLYWNVCHGLMIWKKAKVQGVLLWCSSVNSYGNYLQLMMTRCPQLPFRSKRFSVPFGPAHLDTFPSNIPKVEGRPLRAALWEQT